MQPQIAADAMLLVHHRVADLDLGQVAQHALDRAALLGGAPAPAHHAGIELGLGDDRPALGGQDEAVRQRRDQQREAQVAICRNSSKLAHRRQLEAVLGEVARHRLAPAGRLGGDDHAQPGGLEEPLQARERILRAAVDCERRKRQGADRSAVFVRLVDQIDPGESLRPSIELLGGQEELAPAASSGRSGSPPSHLVARLGVAPELLRSPRRRRGAARARCLPGR